MNQTSLQEQKPARSSRPLGSPLTRGAKNPMVRLALLALAFTLPGLLFLRNFYMTDPDFGWHLKAGEWILSHRTVPFADPFSIFGAGKPWYDYSWLFDVF